MERICVIHFNPIEKYPPVLNLLRYISSNIKGGAQVTVITTLQPGTFVEDELPGIQIKRVVEWEKRSRVQRIFFYWQFHIRALKLLKKLKPHAVLYYETFSAGAPCLYKKWVDPKCKLYIHYHEYTSRQEYQQGIILNRWMHSLERMMYKSTAWISHTNTVRMRLFLQDIGIGNGPNTHILPNYPPAIWHKRARSTKRYVGTRIGFVYVGALSLHTMYTKEMALFIQSHPDEFYWDIYSDNHDEKVLDFLKELNAPNIFFKKSIRYDSLPSVLPSYDIGVILYKGDTFNFRYNAPNKFFEYITCGLNVCYPLTMEGMKTYEQQHTKPWVLGIDFNNIVITEADLRRVAEIPFQKYCAEDIYKDLWKNMIDERPSVVQLSS